MSCGVYIIENTSTGKKYVGQSNKIAHRLKRHRSMLSSGKHYNPHLQNAWDKYGEEKFRFARVLECERQDLTMYEQLIADYYRDGGLYNIGSFVDCPWRGRKSEQSKAQWRKPDYAKKMKARTWYTAPELAKCLGISTQAVWARFKRGKLERCLIN